MASAERATSRETREEKMEKRREKTTTKRTRAERTQERAVDAEGAWCCGKGRSKGGGHEVLPGSRRKAGHEGFLA
jgi:hypothetical protein